MLFRSIDLFNIVNLYIGSKKQHHIQENESTSSEQHTIINKEHLNTLSRGNKAFIKEIIDIFLEQNPNELVELEKSILAKDYSAIRSISHKMKTSVGFIGINQLLPELSTIEKMAINEGDINNIQSKFTHVKTICHQAAIELKEMI